MNKKVKIALLIVASLVILMVGFLTVYKILFSMEVIETSEIGNANAEKKILLVSQGSEFKNELAEILTATFKADDVYIYITDATKIPEVPNNDYSAVILISTVEQWKLEKHVELFLSKTMDYSNVVLVATSGSGEWKTEDYKIDTISSASKMEELGSVSEDVITKVKNIIDNPPKASETE